MTKAGAEPVRSNVVAFARRTPEPSPPDPSALDAEAARRVAALGYAYWLRCERATGIAIPAAIRYRKLQIEFAAEALKRLDPVPENFRADHFWPA